MSTYRIIRLDIASPLDPRHALAKVTMEDGKLISWDASGVELRSNSSDGLLSEVYALMAAFDGAILRESELAVQGVRMVPR